MSLVSNNRPGSPEAAAEQLREKVEALLRDESLLKNGTDLVRLEVQLPNVAPLEWLRLQEGTSALYWSDREHAFEVAGIGEAAAYFDKTARPTRELFTAMRQDLENASAELRFFGGFRFDRGDAHEGPWSAFGAYRFVAPQIEVIQKESGTFLACNLRPVDFQEATDRDELLDRLDNMVFANASADGPLPHLVNRTDTPDRESWTRSIRELLTAFETGPLLKAVLARESRFEFESTVDPAALLAKLKEATTFSYHYGFMTDEGSALVGATPERLFKRDGTRLQSEALAGTRPRGATPEQDDALGQELLASRKESHEHNLVADQIRGVFNEHCMTVNGRQHTELLVLSHCQHLLTHIEGMLSDCQDDDVILDALHPTPAMGGAPTDEALDIISRLEPFERGWYTGPVGWVSRDATEFAAAIRSGLVRDSEVRVYAGAGIVPGSSPEAEYDEIESKLADFQRIFTTGGPAPQDG